jgi:hypothetical protein
MSNCDRVGGFSQGEGVDHDDTLALGYCWSEGGALVDIVASIVQGFEVYERDSHAHNLMITLYGLFISFL